MVGRLFGRPQDLTWNVNLIQELLVPVLELAGIENASGKQLRAGKRSVHPGGTTRSSFKAVTDWK